jgi:hypothetical protein
MNRDFGLIRHELKNPDKSAQQVIEDIQKSPVLLESLVALVSAKDPTFQKSSKHLTVHASLTNPDSLPENLKIDPADISKLFGQIAAVEKTVALSENEFVVTMDTPISAHLCKLAFDGLHLPELGVRFDVEETPDASLFNYNSDLIVKTPESNTITPANDNIQLNGAKEKHRLKNKGKEFCESVNNTDSSAPLHKNFPSLTVSKPNAGSGASNIGNFLVSDYLSRDPGTFEAMMKYSSNDQMNIHHDKSRRFSTTNSDYENHPFQAPGFSQGHQDPRFFKLTHHNVSSNPEGKGGFRAQVGDIHEFDVKSQVASVRKNSLKSKANKLALQKTFSSNSNYPSSFKPLAWAKDEEQCVESEIEPRTTSHENSVVEDSEPWPLPSGIKLMATKSLLPQVPTTHYVYNNPSNKFTCRYDVVIENEKNFQIAKKIIGSKGCNMKNIIENSLGETGLANHPNSKEAIKLRLRGKGSGFLEGPERRESEEMLHLCVSAKNLNVFNITCRHVETLLSKIFDEYVSYQRKSGNELGSDDKSELIDSIKFRKHEPVHGQYYF